MYSPIFDTLLELWEQSAVDEVWRWFVEDKKG